METTGYTLQIATFYILYNPSILQKLQELILAIPNPANIPPLAECSVPRYEVVLTKLKSISSVVKLMV
jgi:hypothetical protein